MKLRMTMPGYSYNPVTHKSGFAKNPKAYGFKKGQKLHPNVIAGRWRGAVKKGEVLNPYGKWGKRKGKFILGKREGSRDRSVAKKRERIEAKKAMALEWRELQELARVNAKGAMRALVDIVNSKSAPEASRIAAAQVILDRGYGKASQTTFNANVGNDGKANQIDENELESRIAKALERVEDLTRGKAKKVKSPEKPVDVRKLN